MALKLLVVDDEKETRNFLGDFFREEGCKVKTALGGLQALSHLKEEKPHKVLLDINMQDLDGLEVLRRIKKLYPDIEVIMVTGVEDISKMEEAKRLGASHYVNKPFILRELQRIVKGA